MPPMRMGGSLRRKTVIPVTTASFGRNSWITWSTCGRSARGFRDYRMLSVPWLRLMPLLPT